MSSNIANTVAYLRTSRDFNEDVPTLCRDVSKAYIDIANSVNVRTIGIFAVNKASITGESWYPTSQRQQGFRQIYAFTGPAPITPIPHGLNLEFIAAFTKIYGTFTDSTIWYPLPYVDVVAANNQINVIVNQTNIVITAGAGAPPTIVSGYVVLEWIVNP